MGTHSCHLAAPGQVRVLAAPELGGPPQLLRADPVAAGATARPSMQGTREACPPAARLRPRDRPQAPVPAVHCPGDALGRRREARPLRTVDPSDRDDRRALPEADLRTGLGRGRRCLALREDPGAARVSPCPRGGHGRALRAVWNPRPFGGEN